MQEEQTSWSFTVLFYQGSIDTNPMSRFYSLVQALSVDEHNHSSARIRYSKFVHYVQNYR